MLKQKLDLIWDVPNDIIFPIAQLAGYNSASLLFGTLQHSDLL